MAYDEGLAQRIREVLPDEAGVSEKRMFGGIAFMVRGHMAVGVVGDTLMVRVGPDAYARLVQKPHARPMDFTGKPMKGFVYVDARGTSSDKALGQWVNHGVAYAQALPPKRK